MPRPTITSQARWTVLTWRVVGRWSAGTASSPSIDGAGAVARVGQPRGEPGDLDAAGDRAVGVEMTEQGLGDVAGGLGHELDGGELGRLVLVHPARQRVADRHLDRRRHGGDAEGDQESEPVVAVATAAQHGEGVHRCHEETADDVRGDDHVGGHQRHGVVEDHTERVDVDDLAVSVEGEPLRRVHPGVGGDHGDAAEDTGDHEWDARPEVRPRATAVASRRCRWR